MFNIQGIKKRLINSKLVKDSFWAIFGNVLGKGLSLLAAIIIARLLGKDVYGEYGILINTVGIILIFSNFGLNYTTTKYIAEYNQSNPGLLSYIIQICQRLTLVFSGIATLALFFSADYVASHFLKLPELNVSLRLI